MQDHTLLRHRNTLGRDHGDNLAADQIMCCIPHCQRRRSDHVNIHLCERHIEKAWAAYQILNGAKVESEPEPKRDRYSLDAKGTVYIARVGDLIKIGWTSDPMQRMGQLQPDAILHFQTGTRRDETALHELCAQHLAKGREWFTANDAMTQIIDNIRLGKVA